MNRRGLLFASLNAAVSLRPALAGTLCDGHTQCQFGLSRDITEVTAKQKNDQWCWAACISNLCAYYGYSLSQENLVEKAFGEIINEPTPNSAHFTALLNRTWRSDDGHPIELKSKTLVDHAGDFYGHNRLV